jgi:hypothetical protein
MGGWVYVFETASMPGTVKIGATTRDPVERLHEANACTWHLPDYALVCATEVDDPFEVERQIHALLTNRRVDPRREFFRATAEEARALIALVAKPEVAVDTEPMEGAVGAGAATGRGPVAIYTIAPTAPHVRSRGISHAAQSRRPHARLANRAVAQQTPQGKLREWVDENYTHVPLRDKDTGTKLNVLYTAYTTCVPPVHQKPLGRNKFKNDFILGKILFGKMLNEIYPNVGPHKNAQSTVSGIYLLR